MQTHPQLVRLEQIASALQVRRGALALIGLGSCGVETARMERLFENKLMPVQPRMRGYNQTIHS